MKAKSTPSLENYRISSCVFKRDGVHFLLHNIGINIYSKKVTKQEFYNFRQS